MFPNASSDSDSSDDASQSKLPINLKRNDLINRAVPKNKEEETNQLEMAMQASIITGSHRQPVDTGNDYNFQANQTGYINVPPQGQYANYNLTPQAQYNLYNVPAPQYDFTNVAHNVPYHMPFILPNSSEQYLDNANASNSTVTVDTYTNCSTATTSTESETNSNKDDQGQGLNYSDFFGEEYAAMALNLNKENRK